MIDLEAYDWPPPTDWQQFERLCRDLWAGIWGDPHTSLHGRPGQQQHGVDVIGSSSGGRSGVQCKRHGRFAIKQATVQELLEEVENARDLVPSLTGELIFAYTGPRDAKLQSEAARINEQHRAEYGFSVTVKAWEDILDLMGKEEGLQTFFRYYPAMVQAVRALESNKAFTDTGDTANTLTEASAPGRSGSNRLTADA